MSLNYINGPRPEIEGVSLYNSDEPKTRDDIHDEKVGMIKSLFRALGFKRSTPTQEQREEKASVQEARRKKAEPLFGGYSGKKPRQL